MAIFDAEQDRTMDTDLQKEHFYKNLYILRFTTDNMLIKYKKQRFTTNLSVGKQYRCIKMCCFFQKQSDLERMIIFEEEDNQIVMVTHFKNQRSLSYAEDEEFGIIEEIE